MDKEKLVYKVMVAVGFVIWILGTWHGGWSATAQSPLEHMTDFIGSTLMFWGIIGDVTHGLCITKNTNITTEKVDLHKHF